MRSTWHWFVLLFVFRKCLMFLWLREDIFRLGLLQFFLTFVADRGHVYLFCFLVWIKIVLFLWWWYWWWNWLIYFFAWEVKALVQVVELSFWVFLIKLVFQKMTGFEKLFCWNFVLDLLWRIFACEGFCSCVFSSFPKNLSCFGFFLGLNFR